MSAQWKKFTGSEEQIIEIRSCTHGLLCKFKDELHENNGCIEEANYYNNAEGTLFIKIDDGEFYRYRDIGKMSEYMIIKPHPHAEMIIEWARTGREVYFQDETGRWLATDGRPSWHPEFKYSFNPVEMENDASRI